MRRASEKAGATTGVPILMYHEVAPPSRMEALVRKIQQSYVSTEEEFEGQIRFLHEHGFNTVSLSVVVDAFARKVDLPPKTVVITFDDGFEGNYTHALPVLRKYGATATFFVVSQKIGEPFMMTWQQLGALVNAGCEVQSHTANHPLLSTLGSAETKVELSESKRAIEAHLNTRCVYLSLPNGDTNPHVHEHALACGYRGICGSRFGFNDSFDTDIFHLDRIAIKGGLSQRTFERIVCGEPAVMRRMRLRAALKSSVANVLGKRRYDRLYNVIYGVDELDKRKIP